MQQAVNPEASYLLHFVSVAKRYAQISRGIPLTWGISVSSSERFRELLTQKYLRTAAILPDFRVVKSFPDFLAEPMTIIVV